MLAVYKFIIYPSSFIISFGSNSRFRYAFGMIKSLLTVQGLSVSDKNPNTKA